MAQLNEDEANALQAVFEAQAEGQEGEEGAPVSGESAEGEQHESSGEPGGEPAGEQEGEEGAGEGTGTPEGEGGEGATPPATLRVGDKDVPVEDLQALIEFQQWTQQNPDKMAAFGSYLRGEAEFVQRQQQAATEQAAQQQATPPPEIDWDVIDPQVKAAYDQQQAQLAEMQQQFESVRNPIAAWQVQQQEQVQKEAAQQINDATDRLNEKLRLDLSPEEIDDLHTVTAKLNILPGLRQSIADPVEAVATALEMAVWQTPKFRDKLVAGQVASQRANEKREVAGRVSGTSGSERSGVSSGPSAGDVSKMDPNAKKAAMAAEIAESLRGTP